jgi:hypothetical protein
MKTPTYITNGYELVTEDYTGYSGVVVGNTLELRHNNIVVDSVTLDDHDPTMFNTTALQIYNDMLEYALSQEN